MKFVRYPIVSLIFLCGTVNSSTTLTSEFIITNRTIEKSDFTSTDTSATFTDTGNGLFRISDRFQDATRDMKSTGNHQWALIRNSSLIAITMTGQKLGHKFTVRAKYANSQTRSDLNATAGFFGGGSNVGCTRVYPRAEIPKGDTAYFIIESDSDVTKECKARTWDMAFSVTKSRSYGVSRDVYIDMGRLIKDPTFRNAPPDIYTGTSVYSGEILKNRVGGGYTIQYINNMRIYKNPYFESVALPPGDNVFDVKTSGSKIHGDLSIPYVINGQFTPYNTISVNVASLNGFHLSGATDRIPYSLKTKMGNQKAYTIANSGVSSGTVTVTNLAGDGGAIRSEFIADFSVDKSAVAVGDYSDTLTAIFQITL